MAVRGDERFALGLLGGECVFFGPYEETGTFIVEVTTPSGVTTTAEPVEVGKDGCHPALTQLTVTVDE